MSSSTVRIGVKIPAIGTKQPDGAGGPGQLSCPGPCSIAAKPLEELRPYDGAWLSLVERLLWEQDVGGSNPLAPTTMGRPSALLQWIRKQIDGAGANFQTGKDGHAIRNPIS